LPWGTFCLRACFGAQSFPYCNNRFDLLGCDFTAPGDYEKCGFVDCQANADLPVGVYNASYTFTQGMSPTPTPVTAPASSQCTTIQSPSAAGVTYSWAAPIATVTAPCFTTTYGGDLAATQTSSSSTSGNKPNLAQTNQSINFLGPFFVLLGILIGAALL